MRENIKTRERERKNIWRGRLIQKKNDEHDDVESE